MANETWVKATFKGEDGSLGFQVGQEYEVKLSFTCSGAVTLHHPREGNIIPYQNCPYANFRALLRNWCNINYSH